MDLLLTLDEKAKFLPEDHKTLVKSLRGSLLFEKIDPWCEYYKSYIENSLKEVYALEQEKQKYRWFAFIYRSDVLQRLIFNHAVDLNADDVDFLTMNNEVFSWYERKAEEGEVCSLFQMALTPSFNISACPYFGFIRNADSNNDRRLVNLTALLPDTIILHYRGLIENVIKGAKAGKKNTYSDIDEILQLATRSILTSTFGLNEAIRIKQVLVSLTGNSNIARRSEEHVVAALLCVAIVDPLWKYYYYIPYNKYSRAPYAAVALALSKPCNLNKVAGKWTSTTSNTFEFLEILESTLRHNVEDESKRWTSFILTQSEALDLAMCFKDVFLKKFGVDVKFSPYHNMSDSSLAQVVLNLNGSQNFLYLNRQTPQIRPVELEHLANQIDQMIPAKLEHCRPQSALTIALEGWLDVDIINSSQIFSDLERHESYTLSELIKAFFEDKILGTGALRTNETPDGWMCGFLRGEDAIRAGIGLIFDIKSKLNEKLQAEHPELYKKTNDGIGIRVGINKHHLIVKADQKLQEVAAEPLNLTGHLQKKSGNEFVRIFNEQAANRITEKDIAWTFALSYSANEELERMTKEDINLDKLIKTIPLTMGFSLHDQSCQLYGSTKGDNKIESKIDTETVKFSRVSKMELK